MTEILSFTTEEQLDTRSLEAFLSSQLACTRFIWVNSFYEYAAENELNDTATYIALETSTGRFKFHYNIFTASGEGFSLRRQIELLVKLSRDENSRILSADEEINPWSYVLIGPDGQTSTVTIGDEEQAVEEVYNFPFGDLRAQAKLTDAELHLLRQIIAPLYPEAEISYSTDGPVINGDFNKVKDRYDELRLFNHHYEILPTGKNKWMDRETKSELFSDLMLRFHQQTNKPLCIFPANYSEIKNIEGGSDSEEHCFLLSQNTSQKIVYKQRRKSWLR